MDHLPGFLIEGFTSRREREAAEAAERKRLASELQQAGQQLASARWHQLSQKTLLCLSSLTGPVQPCIPVKTKSSLGACQISAG